MNGRILELVSKIHLDWKRRVARDLAPHGIGPKQIFVLRKLAESGGLIPSEIAVLIHGDRPSVTSMLRTLEREGWVTRRRDPVNGRRVKVEISPAGRKKLASVPDNLWRSGRTTLDPEACLDAEEQARLVRLLARVHRAILDSPEGR
ncbi:MAG TPA: MarR family transcriptional regulator [Holophaga sp.]|nr:MarR family transcriptional regulator [Holophaga sp.]HPS66896.1 MarR family transcriptional regulator [Holophaga sp.]